jgi:hypothetical protein
MADIEQGLLAECWAEVRAERPVFVTSLPRAGTTILLEVLFRLPGMATHTYRDMPFVLAPVLWDRIAARFRRRSEPRERAHGDGLAVNEDSPEAFEEVLWQRHYPGKYRPDAIELWRPHEADAVFRDCFALHMRKIISLRTGDAAAQGRYVSKNNANVARTALLRKLFPDAQILIPFRDPLEHAVSLWRQHQSFVRQHRKDLFVRDYMGYIGHYEFGDLHRPIAFPGLEELHQDLAEESVDYWLAYWVAAFRYLLKQREVQLFSYEALCAKPGEHLKRIIGELQIEAGEAATREGAALLRSPSPGRGRDHSVQPSLEREARDIQEQLGRRCLLTSS